MLGSLFTKETDGFQEVGLDCGPLILADPAEELVAVGRRELTQFPGLASEQIGGGNSSTQLMGKDISTLLRRDLNPKYV
jgi:hypothetical protein